MAAGRLPAHAAPVARRAVGAAPAVATASTSTTTSRASTRSPPAGSAAARSSTPTSCCARTPTTFAADGLPLAPADLDAPLRRRARDAARRALPVGATARPRRARCSTPRGCAGLSAERPPLAVAFGERPGQPFDDGAANLHGAPRETCRLCGALRRRLPVRGQADRRLHLPDRGGRRRARTCARCCEARALDRDGDGWRVRYRQHLAARDGHPEHLLDPGRAGRPRGARRSRRARRRARSARPACCCATAPRCPGSARAWGAASRATATCCSSCSTPTATSTPPPARSSPPRSACPTPSRPAGAASSSRTPARPPSRSGCGRASRRPATCVRALRRRSARRGVRDARARRRPWRRCWAWAATCRAGAWSCAATASC